MKAVVFAMLVAASSVVAADGSGTIVYGGDKADGWGFSVSVPPGWDFDCCARARDVGSNLLVFPDGWTGASSDGVITLRVWAKRAENLDADWKKDVDDYKKEFPNIVSANFSLHVKGSECRAAMYTGTDDLQDYVAICDPGVNWHYRFSWSMLIRSDEAPSKESVFRRVVESANLLHVTQDH